MYNGQKYTLRGGETIPNEKMVCRTYGTIVATGLFAHACTKWRKYSASERTWDKYKEYFTEANRDRSKKLTAAEGTFTSNQVEEMVTEQLESLVLPPDAYKSEQNAAAAANKRPAATVNALTTDNFHVIFQDLLCSTRRKPQQEQQQL